jgi:hypothetical protein
MDEFHQDMDEEFPFIIKKVVLNKITHISRVLEQVKMPSKGKRRKNKINEQPEMWKHPF